MDGHGEQPGPTPGGGAGRSENLEGGVQRKATGGNRPTGRIRLYREEPAQLYRAGGVFPVADL